MDNKIFQVNGDNQDDLLLALKLIFGPRSCKGWFETKGNGLVLLWYYEPSKKDIKPLPVDFTAKECMPFVSKWLLSDFAKNVELAEWCGDVDHDGDNGEGWYVYVEDWGHVAENHCAICGIKPAFAWYGK